MPADREACLRLGNRIKQARTLAGLTQEQLAHRLGEKRAYLAGIETGRQWPSLQFVGQCERECGCEEGLLISFWLEPRKRRTPEVADTALDEPDSLRSLGSKTQGPSPALYPDAHGRGRRKSVVISCTAGMLLVGVVLWWIVTRDDSLVVRIVAPSDGATVCYQETVSGTWARLRPSEHIWLVLKSRNDSLLYPQPGGPLDHDVGPDKRKTWSGTAYFGTGPGSDGGYNEVFSLTVVVARPEANAQLLSHIDTLRETPNAGLRELPRGVTVADRATVTRGLC